MSGAGRARVGLGRWLREQRRERGWNVPEMTRQLRQAAKMTGDTLPGNECLYTMIRRWERGDTGVSERYVLHYCRAFGIAADQFGPGADGYPAGPRTGETGPGSVPWLARVLRDIRDGFREETRLCQARASQIDDDPVRVALCRGQALAYAAAAEHIDAALASGVLLGQKPPTG